MKNLKISDDISHSLIMINQDDIKNKISIV
jgi:hypothetical protein